MKRRSSLFAATGILALALLPSGCESQAENGEASSGGAASEAENHLNHLFAAIGDQDFEAACTELTPEGTASLLSGGTAPTGTTIDREDCPAAMKASPTLSGKENVELPPLKVLKIRQERGGFAVKTNGGTWHVATENHGYALIAVPGQ